VRAFRNEESLVEFRGNSHSRVHEYPAGKGRQQGLICFIGARMVCRKQLYPCQRLQALVATAGAGLTLLDALLGVRTQVEFGLLHRGNFKSAGKLRNKEAEAETMENFEAL